MVEMVNVAYGRSGTSKATNAMGQRPMQARAYAARAAQFLLLKAPPAAGKSRALMFIALDKLRHQGLAKVIVCVPETSIGGSFLSNDLTRHGFEADWQVEDRWNLCLSGAEDAPTSQKVRAFAEFMASDARVLVCTHATFRFGFDAVEAARGIEAFDEVFLAIDEFHHVSADDNNRLGQILRRVVSRERAHVMAMTIGIRGLMEPPTARSREICEKDMNDLMATACQAMDARVLNPETAPEVATQMVLTEIIERRYENLSPEETEAVRQDLAARMNILTLARREEERGFAEAQAAFAGAAAPLSGSRTSDPDEDDLGSAPNSLLALVRRFINVRELDIDLIDSVNAFRERFEVASKSLDSDLLAHVQSAMVAQRVQMTEDEARTLWPRIKRFRAQEGREPNVHAADALEKRMAEALAWLKFKKTQKLREASL